MSRQREIEQGMRHPDGGLIGGLDCLEYSRGWSDYEAGAPPPDITSRDYDLGRARAAERREAELDVMARIKADQDATDERMRAVLADHPEALADYERQIAAIRAKA